MTSISLGRWQVDDKMRTVNGGNGTRTVYVGDWYQSRAPAVHQSVTQLSLFSGLHRVSTTHQPSDLYSFSLVLSPIISYGFQM